MRIIGHGIDIVEIDRVMRMLDQHGDRFLERCFTEGERGFTAGRRRRDEHLAARFAAKEAALKALGTGWRSGIAWTDVEVVSLPSGQPTLRLHGQAQRTAEEMGITDWSLTLSHTATYAVASAIATGP